VKNTTTMGCNARKTNNKHRIILKWIFKKQGIGRCSKNEEAIARYRAVKNTATMGCNARKTNNKHRIILKWIFKKQGIGRCGVD